MRPANERRRYIVTTSLIGWAHIQNDSADRRQVPPSQSITLPHHGQIAMCIGAEHKIRNDTEKLCSPTNWNPSFLQVTCRKLGFQFVGEQNFTWSSIATGDDL